MLLKADIIAQGLHVFLIFYCGTLRFFYSVILESHCGGLNNDTCRLIYLNAYYLNIIILGVVLLERVEGLGGVVLLWKCMTRGRP